MTTKKKTCVGVCTLTLITILALGLPLLLDGCGGCQKEEQAAPAPKPLPAPEKAKEAAPPVEPPLGPVVPVTLGLLKLTPESAMVTVALPPVTGLFDKGVALAKRVAPAGVDIDAALAEAVAQMAQDASAPDAKSLGEIAKARGLNADAAMAVYIDLAATAESCKAAFEAMKKEQEVQKAAPATPGAEPASKTEQAPKAEGSAAPAPAVEAKPVDMQKVFASMKVPAIVGVVGCADPAKAEFTISEILAAIGGYVDPGKSETVDVGGVAVKCYDPDKFAYAIVGDKLVVGNSLALLKQVLGRISAPSMIRYGTIECLASSPDEVVMLTRMDKIAPLAKELLPLMAASQSPTGQLPPGQWDYLNKTLDAFAGDDPLVATVEWTDKKLEFLNRCDFAKHPALAALSGEAQPLRLAPMLPETAQMMLSMRLNDQTKQEFKSGWIDSLPPEVKSQAGVTQALTNLNEVLEVVGDEITAGVAPGPGGIPQIYLLAGISNVDKAKSLLQTLVPAMPAMPAEPYNGVDISTLPIPMMPLHFAFAENTLAICNDLDKLKGIIDMVKGTTTSKLFASLDPPMDPATPRYFAMLVKSSLIPGVMTPLAIFMPSISPGLQGPMVDRLIGVVRELRMTKDLKGSWIEGRLTIHLSASEAKPAST
jgi:hypothetical protein